MSLISGHSQAQSAYEPTLWAKVFHSVPHVNITFHSVDSRFNPENDLYLESIGILASIPAAWLITTLVVLLIYLCTRCCDTKSTKKRKSRPMRCCLSFFAVLTGVALVLGYFGNHFTHMGMEDFEKATGNINSIVKRSQEMTKKYNDVVMNGIEKNLNRLYDGPFQRDIRQDRTAHFEIMDACDIIFNNISKGLEAMDELRFTIADPANHQMMSFQYIPYWAHAFEKYRWPATMALQGLFVLFCLLLFVGAIVHSRCVLILFSVCGLFSIILLWVLASLYTATSVALADFCHNPTPWVKHSLYANSKLDEGITTYYLQCAPGKSNPFESYLSKSTRAINDIDRRVRLISEKSRKYYSPLELTPFLDDLERHSEETMQLMNDLSMSLRCEPIFRSYNTALVAVCDLGLFGLILMLISVAASGLLFTILVWCNSHTWIYFKHKGRYIKVDDADPYMPLSTIERPRLMTVPSSASAAASSSAYGYSGRARSNIHTPPQTPPYHGTLNGSSTLRASQAGMAAPSPYGHLGHGGSMMQQQQHGMQGHHPHVMQHGAGTLQHHGSRGNVMGRNANVNSHATYQGLDNLPATMTLGRRGHYASLRSSRAGGDNEAPLLGPNMGQYATLSKQCKTLESSDFY